MRRQRPIELSPLPHIIPSLPRPLHPPRRSTFPPRRRQPRPRRYPSAFQPRPHAFRKADGASGVRLPRVRVRLLREPESDRLLIRFSAPPPHHGQGPQGVDRLPYVALEALSAFAVLGRSSVQAVDVQADIPLLPFLSRVISDGKAERQPDEPPLRARSQRPHWTDSRARRAQ